jgi:TRAP-type C4-dicarboxylate transport system permease small subunit
LALIAGWMIFMRLVDLFWVTAPSWSPEHVNPGVWMYAVIPVAMVGLWLALFLSNYVKRPVIALYDPRVVDIYGEAHE